MDSKTKETLRIIKSHFLIKDLLTYFCYGLILVSIAVYIFYGLSQKIENIKLINDYKENSDQYNVTKIMTNPKIKFQHSDNKTYEIEAKEAADLKKNDQYILYDVLVKSDIGNITAGKLEVIDNGNHLIFSTNPVMIINSLD
jgi:hypothetical protein